MDKFIKFLFTTVSGAILFGSVIISLSILVSGGVIRLKGSTVEGTATTQTAQNPTQQTQPAPTTPSTATASLGHLPIKGSDTAKVAVIEFGDLRCPFCDQFFKQTEPQLLTDYVDTGKVKFAFRQYEFLGPASTTAGNAVECANGQGKFWEMHDYLYQNQPDESDISMYTTDKLTSIAGSLGMDTNQFQSCLSTTKYAQNVSQDLADGSKIGVTATPTFLIGKLDSTGKNIVNGQLVVGAEPYATIKTVIDQQLSQ